MDGTKTRKGVECTISEFLPRVCMYVCVDTCVTVKALQGRGPEADDVL